MEVTYLANFKTIRHPRVGHRKVQRVLFAIDAEQPPVANPHVGIDDEPVVFHPLERDKHVDRHGYSTMPSGDCGMDDYSSSAVQYNIV
jgi:hypothetical protein